MYVLTQEEIEELERENRLHSQQVYIRNPGLVHIPFFISLLETSVKIMQDSSFGFSLLWLLSLLLAPLDLF